MQVRKQRRQLITRLEKTREECLEAKAHFLTALAADPWDENRRGEEFRIWYDRRHKTIDPLAQQARELEEKTFLGFAELVGVAPGRMKDFAHKARSLVVEANHDNFCRRGKPYHQHSPALRGADLALRKAMEAVEALSKAERYSIGLALWLAGHHDRTILDYVKGDSDEWVSVLAQLVNAASVAVGASSQAPVLGKLNVNHKDWPLLNFVQQLWQLTREFGGGLNYSRKNGIGGGSLMSALHFLKPLLPSGMLDNPPYAAIETLIRVEKRRTARQEVVPVPF